MKNSEDEKERAASKTSYVLLLTGIVLVFVGIAIILLAGFVFGNPGSFGGIIMIGPIPIIFGTGIDATWLIALGAILTIISIVISVVLSRRK